jgi:hypothetical protein
LTKNSKEALLTAYSAPPMAGPIARLTFWLTAPSAIACVRSSGATSSGVETLESKHMIGHRLGRCLRR